MEAQLRQHGDPREYFAVWAEEYEYSVAQLRNILKDVQRKNRLKRFSSRMV
jgi:hypothetical protein